MIRGTVGENSVQVTLKASRLGSEVRNRAGRWEVTARRRGYNLNIQHLFLKVHLRFHPRFLSYKKSSVSFVLRWVHNLGPQLSPAAMMAVLSSANGCLCFELRRFCVLSRQLVSQLTSTVTKKEKKKKPDEHTSEQTADPCQHGGVTWQATWFVNSVLRCGSLPGGFSTGSETGSDTFVT